MAKGTLLYFVSDLHGSSLCFRKFVNATQVYKPTVLVLGGDLAGKAIQSIVKGPNGRWNCTFIGNRYELTEGTGGRGRWRGGLGSIREFEFTEPGGFSIEGDGSKFPPPGLFGGADGTPGAVLLNAGTEREQLLPSKLPYRKAAAGERPPVSERKIGTVPTGSMITKRVTKTSTSRTVSSTELMA